MAGLRPRRDHPRVCGEKALTSIPRDKPQGSPPRVRGKVGHALHVGVGVGITPACAGKSKFPRERGAGSWDHPRVCGEKLRSHLRSSGRGGITPACAGKSSSSFWCSGVSIGSPPACAGKSGARRRTRRLRADHPRVCGEKASVAESKSHFPGSPPRVRGKALDDQRRAGKTRITPACAGKSTVAGLASGST